LHTGYGRLLCRHGRRNGANRLCCRQLLRYCGSCKLHYCCCRFLCCNSRRNGANRLPCKHHHGQHWLNKRKQLRDSSRLVQGG